MSSAPASALLSMIPAAAPAVSAAQAAQTTDAIPVEMLDAAQNGAFTRLLEAEASLAQAVASATSAMPEEAAAERAQTAVESPADSANDVAVALAQAAHVSLAPRPVVELEQEPVTETLEQPVQVEQENTDLTSDAESTSDTELVSRKVPTLPSDTAKIAPQTTKSPSFVATIDTQETRETRETQETSEAPEMLAAPALRSESKTVVTTEQKTVPAEAAVKSEAIAINVPMTVETDVEPAVVLNNDASNPQDAIKSQDPFSVGAQIQKPETSKSPESMQAPIDLPGESTEKPVVSTARVVPAEKDAPITVENEPETEEASVEEFTAPGIYLGAAGVLSVMTSREPRAATVEIEPTEDAEPQLELSIESDTGYEQPARAPLQIRTGESMDSEPMLADSLGEIEESSDSLAKPVAADNPEIVPTFAKELGEVRVISSQMSRKEVLPEAEKETSQSEIEIQPKQTEISSTATDKKSGEKVAEPTRITKRAEIAQVLSPRIDRGNGEMVARQSSPEGFSFDAGQREISASAVTAPSLDGGRPETIASRNSATSNNTAPQFTPATRAERLSGQILESIPNPLRVTTFEIKPEGHGPIRVRISARGEGESAVWRVQIQTSDPAARSLLSDHLSELRERLPAENVQVELRGANDVRTEVTQRESGSSRERNGEQRQSRGDEQRQPRQQKAGNFLEWLKAQE